MPAVPLLAEIITAMDGWFDPSTAEDFDAVGPVCGDPAQDVDRIVLAVDPVPATVDEAIDAGARLLITHHPLLLRGVHGVPADDPKGALVHRMIRAGVAHFVAHTNADVADPGVSDALAARLDLTGLTPLRARPAPALDKLTVFVPVERAEELIDALAAAGAGRLGDYDRCAFTVEGVGTFRPGPGATPAVGAVGERTDVAEARVEMVLPPSRRGPVVAAMRAVHPYEEPAFDLVTHAPIPSTRGTGRVGELDRVLSLAAFTRLVAAVLPATAVGVRAAGDPGLPVRRVAVCGGSGSPYVEDARRAGAEAYLTGDLKHHTVVEAGTERGPAAMALLDAGHWATEAPWLDDLAGRLRERFGTTVDVAVSTRVTDPWSVHSASPPA